MDTTQRALRTKAMIDKLLMTTSKRSIAHTLNVHEQTITNWITGKTTASKTNFRKLEKLFNAPSYITVNEPSHKISYIEVALAVTLMAATATAFAVFAV